MNPLDAIRFIRSELGYEKKLEDFSERLGLSIEALRGILATLENIAQGIKTLKDFADRLKHLEQLMQESGVAFGIGRITIADVEGDLLEVNFRKLGIKQFSLKVCLEGKLVSSVL